MDMRGEIELMKQNLEGVPTMELLQGITRILEELKRRGTIRTDSALVGEYAESLVADRLRLKLQTNSNAGYDAVDSQGARYQIKGRKVTASNPSRQLGNIHNLETGNFDFLIAVVFHSDFSIESVLKISHEGVRKLAKPKSNYHILVLGKAIMQDSLVEDITDRFL
jgi:hypothetical protein